MAFDKAILASYLEGIIALPDVEASILYSRGGVPVLIMPPNYANAFLLKQLGFVIRSEWSLRDIFTDPDRWRIVSRQLDSYIILLVQLSQMFLLGIILTDLTTEMEETLLTAVENLREALFESL